MKKLISFLLVLSGVISFCLPAAASGFQDVSDESIRRNVAVLQALKVIDGMPDGTFRPDGVLTRAQFCKMAVIVMGKESAVPQNKLYTIFPDVRANHWAAGYVNTAAKGEGRIIAGYPDGTFGPEDEITYAQAVTILMRLLGYKDADVGAVWPEGYLSAAGDAGLTDGISLSPGSSVSRAQAALLFCNLLSSKIKGSEDIYLSKVAGSTVKNIVFLSNTATASDGTANAVKTSGGTYKTTGSADLTALLGCRGTLALDKDGKFLTFLPDRSGSRRTVTLSSSGYNYIKTAAGETLSIPPKATAYIGGDGEDESYEKAWMHLRSGDQVSIYYNAAGEVEYLFVNAYASQSAMVARNVVTGNPFASLAEGAGQYRMLKNGVPVDASAIRRYDVATWDSATKTIYISDRRFTGICQSIYPNQETPAAVTVLGHRFDVLPSAAADLRSVKPGDSVTLLLTSDNKVAGAVSSSVLRANMAGIATAVSTGSATVELFNGITLSGPVRLSAEKAAQLVGQLVTVGSYNREELSLNKLSESINSSALYVKERKLGSIPLAQNIQVFEQVGNSSLVRIALDDLTQEKISAVKIKYMERDYAGNISILVLNDVTGDRYTYGFIVYIPRTDDVPAKVTVDDGTKDFPVLYTTHTIKGGDAGGLVEGLNGMTAGAITLKRLSSVPRAAFSGEDSVNAGSKVLPISDNVKCYLSSSRTWVDLGAALAYSDTFNIYYDREPEEGGKVRLITVS